MLVSFGEMANLRNGGQIRLTLLDALEKHSEILLDASQIVDVDLCFIQLIMAARAQALRENKTIALSKPANSAVTALLERGGFLAGFDSYERDFWFNGGRLS